MLFKYFNEKLIKIFEKTIKNRRKALSFALLFLKSNKEEFFLCLTSTFFTGFSALIKFGLNFSTFFNINQKALIVALFARAFCVRCIKNSNTINQYNKKVVWKILEK